jgi:hypothetical protein
VALSTSKGERASVENTVCISTLHLWALSLLHAVLFTESVDSGVRQRIESSSSGKKLAVSGYLSATHPNKKLKSNKKKL